MQYWVFIAMGRVPYKRFIKSRGEFHKNPYAALPFRQPFPQVTQVSVSRTTQVAVSCVFSRLSARRLRCPVKAEGGTESPSQPRVIDARQMFSERRTVMPALDDRLADLASRSEKEARGRRSPS